MCLTFVFSALLEFALVNYASRSDMQREKLKLHRRYDMETQGSFESGRMSATPASTSASPHHLRHPHHDPSAPSTSNHRHRPPHFCRHNSFGAEHDSPFNDYSTLVRETVSITFSIGVFISHDSCVEHCKYLIHFFASGEEKKWH